MTTQSKQPVHTIRYGAVRIAIWENTGQNGSFHNATFERTYRDAEDQPQSASSFGVTDLGNLNLALAEAAKWMNDNRPPRS